MVERVGGSKQPPGPEEEEKKVDRKRFKELMVEKPDEASFEEKKKRKKKEEIAAEKKAEPAPIALQGKKTLTLSTKEKKEAPKLQIPKENPEVGKEKVSTKKTSKKEEEVTKEEEPKELPVAPEVPLAKPTEASKKPSKPEITKAPLTEEAPAGALKEEIPEAALKERVLPLTEEAPPLTEAPPKAEKNLPTLVHEKKEVVLPKEKLPMKKEKGEIALKDMPPGYLPNLQVLPQPIVEQAAILSSPLASFLPSELVPLFERMVGTMIAMSQAGIDITQITLNLPSFVGSIFFGAKIRFERYSTAPDSYNISLTGSEEAVALFATNIDSLLQNFTRGKFPFRIGRIWAEYERRPLVRRKEPIE